MLLSIIIIKMIIYLIS